MIFYIISLLLEFIGGEKTIAMPVFRIPARRNSNRICERGVNKCLPKNYHLLLRGQGTGFG